MKVEVRVSLDFLRDLFIELRVVTVSSDTLSGTFYDIACVGFSPQTPRDNKKTKNDFLMNRGLTRAAKLTNTSDPS